MLSATDAKTHSASYVYDALGRVTSQGDAISARTMQYNAGGRRTRLTWSDGNYISYEYDATNAMTVIKEGGSSLLATFGYDALGRRATLTRGNGATTSYCYASAAGACSGAGTSIWLTRQSLDLADTANDQSYDFTYNAAGQIATRSASNDAYAWTQHYNVNRPYTANALNQYSSIGSAPNALTPAYDGKGNLTAARGATYTFNTKNQLVLASDTGKQFYFDPAGRIDAVLKSAAAPDNSATLGTFQYDGANISDETAGAAPFAITRRYVYGPGSDEALVWYEGRDLSSKRYLIADERGSIVAVTNAAGNPLAINAYDDYGIPASTNLGRLQYTGQAWIPELGMYDYKARTYSPTLGRFLQTDPSGYGDGINSYNYAGGDPVNSTGAGGGCKRPAGRSLRHLPSDAT